jgi:hypothetical protein
MLERSSFFGRTIKPSQRRRGTPPWDKALPPLGCGALVRLGFFGSWMKVIQSRLLCEGQSYSDQDFDVASFEKVHGRAKSILGSGIKVHRSLLIGHGVRR